MLHGISIRETRELSNFFATVFRRYHNMNKHVTGYRIATLDTTYRPLPSLRESDAVLVLKESFQVQLHR